LDGACSLQNKSAGWTAKAKGNKEGASRRLVKLFVAITYGGGGDPL